jgi:hypothetical protein
VVTAPVISSATITFSPAQAPPGQSVSVSASGGQPSATDWIAMYSAGTSDTGFLDWKYLNNSQTAPGSSVRPGSIAFTAPTTPGAYEFRFFAAGDYIRLATSSALTVTSPAAAITFSPAQAAPGQSIPVSATGGQASATDWIAVYAVGSPDDSFLDWKYLNNSQTAPASSVRPASLAFSAPTAPGPYEFRLFAAGDYTRLATSSTLTVAPPPATITSTSTKATPGQSIPVTAAGGTAAPTDWVALYLVGASDQSFIDWKYLSNSKTAPGASESPASLTFTAPTTPGSYEFRFFAAGDYTLLAKSVPVSVGTGLTILVSKGGITLQSPITPIRITTDDTKVTKVELYIDGQVQGMAVGTSLVYKWDSRKLIGNHSVMAISYAGSAVSESKTVAVTVQ